MAPLRVLQVLWDLDIGGNRTEALNLVRHADRARVEPHLLCGRRPGIVRPEEADELGATWVPLRRKYDLGFAAALARHAEAIGADVLHTHNFNGHIAAALALRRMARRPVLVSTLGGLYRPARSTPWNEALYAGYRTITYRLLRRADGAIAVSRAVEAMLLRRGIPASRIRVIPHGVDPSRLEGDGAAVRAEFSIPPDAPLVVTVARLDPMKGHFDLLEAAAEVRRRVPSVRFLLVGSGPLEVRLRARARRARLEGAVLFSGVRTDVPSFLRAADLFVLPSVDEREGFGIALLEAMACGLPIVGSRVGGIPEVVPDGGAGLLVPPRDPRALADAIAALVADPARRKAMGAEGRRLVEEKFSARVCVARTETFYEELRRRRDRASSA
ncbi:MAG TPA: glycosyltransferase [Planctomycetota bacterium]|nr:glycosyltransferase [Planctomycetota bacterium]